jgi:hypothetical protein
MTAEGTLRSGTIDQVSAAQDIAQSRWKTWEGKAPFTQEAEN